MSGNHEYPVLTRSEHREIFRAAQQSGPVVFPWHLIALLVAFLLMLSSYWVLMLESTWACCLSGLLLANGMLMLQVVLHEAAHHSLFRSSWVNAVMGWFAGLLVLTPFSSYRRGHVAHHCFAGTMRDPTAAPDAPRWHKGVVTCLVKLHVVPILYLGGVYVPYLIYDSKSKSTKHKLEWCLNLLEIILLQAMLAWLLGPVRYLIVLAFAFWLSAMLYEYLFTQHQHVGLLPVPRSNERYSLREQQVFSRSVRMRCAGLLMFFNLHKEHHLFPSLPCCYLPRVHHWLQQNRPDVLGFTSEHLGVLQRRSDLRIYAPSEGDHEG
ncbi:MAG: fatty acid desaturase family protein [Rubripirellula sp.]